MPDSWLEAESETVAAGAHPISSAAFTHLYRRYLTPIYSYIYSRVNSQADAEDLTEQVFTEALEGMARYEEQGKAGAWLFIIARRRVIDHYRARRETLPFEEERDSPLHTPNPEAEVIRGERLERLARLVAGLEGEKRELLQLRFVAELTYREIGQVVGLSEGAVKKNIYRLLEQLRVRWSVADLLTSQDGHSESGGK